MRVRSIFAAAALAFSAQAPSPASAEPAGIATRARPTLTAAMRKQALQAIRQRLERAYIHPEQVPRILAKIDAAAARYRTSDPARFASLVTEDMQAVTNDTHLYLNFEPEWYRAAISPPDQAALAASNLYETQHARDFNYGLVETRLLPGNVRYLKIAGFFWIEGETEPAIDAAIRFLKGGRAIIIDLRSNRGGDTDALDYLRSHFFAPGTLMTTLVSPGSPDAPVLSRPDLPGGRLTGIPLYVLINHRSRSAAEAFAYSVAQFKLGELIGERTEGAAHFSDDTAVPPFFRFSVPLGYARDPVSLRDWEGTGVAPTIEAAAPDALNVAYDLALSRLLPVTADGIEKDFLIWARDGLAAQRMPRPSGDTSFAAFTGLYGPASVELRDGVLYLVGPGLQPRRLRPIGAGGLFEDEDDDTYRIRIAEDGLHILRPGNARGQYYPRETASVDRAVAK